MFMKSDALMFVASLRDTGYSGDIVVAVAPNSDPKFLKVWKHYKCVVYTVSPACSGEDHDKTCTFDVGDKSPPVSINVVRFYMYRWWARQYRPGALVLVTDFRDVFFQSNPFAYHPSEWAPPVAQFVAFQEPYPNKVIYRCPFNGGWIRGCYGEEGLRRIGGNTVSCSGASIATAEALRAYAYLLTQQLNPVARYGHGTKRTNDGCITGGMDQGLHNWLLYSGLLARYVDVKIYQQGEGPVNTVGGFFGTRIPLKIPLVEWGVLRGQSPHQMIHNWNGDPSPVIHQADRFLQTQIAGGYDSLEVKQRVIAQAKTIRFD